MHSGDLAVIDAEGFCNITGRVKDMICRGGENIYPREVEEFLFTHPGIAQAQVFGVPDEKIGRDRLRLDRAATGGGSGRGGGEGVLQAKTSPTIKMPAARPVQG